MSEMQGIEQPALKPYGLTPPSRHLYPAYVPLRNVRYRLPLPRYAPGPLADDMARVILADDYYIGPEWIDYYSQTSCSPDAVFDIPAEQQDRWRAALDAYRAMQEEIEALMDARRRNPEPVKRGPYIPQP